MYHLCGTEKRASAKAEEMTMVFDNKKEHKEFYLPPKTPGIVNAPAMSFLAARGHGEPEKQAMWF